MAIFNEAIRLLISANTAGAAQPLDRLAKQSKETETAFERMSRAVGVNANTLKAGLVAGAAAFVSTQLVDYLRDSAVAYAEAAKAAGDLANATGSSVETVSRMQAALKDAGVSAELSATMLTKFATVASSKKGATALQELNVELVKGKTGIVDYAETMVQAVGAISQIGDASLRNQKLVALFGRAGAKAFQDMLNSGLSLRQAMDEIASNRVFNNEDLIAAMDFDAALDEAAAAAEGIRNTVGRELLPVFVDITKAVGPFVNALGRIPPSFIEVGLAAVVLSRVLQANLVASAISGIGTMVATAITALSALRAGLISTAAIATAAGRAISTAFLSNPITALAVGIGLITAETIRFNDHLKTTNVEIEKLVESGQSLEEAMAAVAGLSPEQFNKVKSDPMLGPVVEAQAESFKEHAAAVEDSTEKLGAWAQAQENVKTTQDVLNDLIASGVTSGQQFTDAVNAAGQALAKQDENARLAAQALDQYAAASFKAYEATLKLLGAARGERSAQRAAEGAADSAANAKANMDKALASAKAAKVITETISAIKGRDRQREEREGIVEGSITVSEIERIAGRRARKVTRVVEAAGVITPEEARQIREATRQYEESLDNIALAWENLAQAKIAHQEALGINLSDVEKLGIVAEELRKGLESPGLSQDAKKFIQEDLDIVERKIKELGGLPIEIDGIKFKAGTTQEEVDKLKAEMEAAFRVGNIGVGREIQRELDELEFDPDKIPPMKVSIVGPDGKPLDQTSVDIGVDKESIDATQTTLANIGIDPNTGEPYKVTYTVALDPGTVPSELGALMLDPVTGEDRIATIDAAMDPGTVQAELDALSKDREMTITVNYVRGLGGDLPGLEEQTRRTMRIPIAEPTVTLTSSALARQQNQPVNFSPTIVNNYPTPERASDSIAMSLRLARYSVGV